MKGNKGIYTHLSGLMVLILSIWISRFFPNWIENHYSLIIFPKLSSGLKYIFGWIKIPLFFPLLIIFLYKLIRSIIRVRSNWTNIFDTLLKYILFACSAFYILWAYNYQRVKVEDKILLNKIDFDESEVLTTFYDASRRLDSLSYLVHGNLDTLSLPVDLKEIAIRSVKSTLNSLGYKHFEIGKFKEFWPKGFLLHLSTAGFYFPFTGEANYDGGLHPLQLPFVLCHEYLHAQGFGDEGECNFIAYLACKSSKNPFFEYSADIALYKTIISLDNSGMLLYMPVLGDLVKADLKDISFEMSKYPDYFPEIRDKIYDLYLKIQGIPEGENNYNNFVRLLIKYNTRTNNVF